MEDKWSGQGIESRQSWGSHRTIELRLFEMRKAL